MEDLVEVYNYENAIGAPNKSRGFFEDEEYTYTLIGWEAEDGTVYALEETLPAATADTTYTAVYEQTAKEAEHVCTPSKPVIENEIPATCTVPGSYDSVIYCAECGEEMSRDIIEIKALGHTKETIPAVEPTYESVGYTEGTKCSVCGTVLVEPTEIPKLEKPAEPLTGSVRLRSAALYLLDMVSVVYKLSDDTIATKTEDVVERGVLLFNSEADALTKDPKLAVKVVAEWDAKESLYLAYTEGISARNMGVSQFAVAYVELVDGTVIYGTKNGEVQAPIEYSPLKYCQNKMNDAKVGKLCRALMYYGAAAQVAQEGKTTGLMNEGFEAVAFDQNYLGEEVFSVNSEIINGMKLRSVALELKGAISYVVKLTPESDLTKGKQLFAEYTLLGKTESVACEPGTDGRLWATISGVAAKDMGETLTVKPYYIDDNGEKVYGGELVYSGYEYTRRALTNKNYTEAEKELARSLATYVYYANKYGYNK
jgi:hypothetical protein